MGFQTLDPLERVSIRGKTTKQPRGAHYGGKQAGNVNRQRIPVKWYLGHQGDCDTDAIISMIFSLHM